MHLQENTLAHIKSRKHAAPRQSALTYPAAISLMALAMPVAAQTVAAPQPAASGPAVTTLPAVKAKAKTTSATEVDYKADTVSSPKFTQPLVDTPQTVTVIKKELLRQQGATTLSEALRNTPGVTMLLGENGNTASGDSIFMRGFDTSTSIFVDGIRDLGAISRDVFNTEQVEVVKGPSGADTGRGAASGYVNLASKVPFSERVNAGSVTVGTHNRFRATADLNLPFELGGAGAGIRLNLMTQDYGVPGRDEVKKKSYGFAPSLAFGLNSPTRTYLTVLHTKQDNVPDGGVSTIGKAGWRPAATQSYLAGSAEVDSENFYGSTNDFEKIEVNMFTARIEHDVTPTLKLRNTARYGRSTQESLLTGVNAINPAGSGFVIGDPSTYTVARSRQGKYQENEILTNQTNVTAEIGSGAVTHSVTGGIEFILERQNTPAYVAQGAAGWANLYNPNAGDTFQSVARSGAYSKGTTVSAAVYAFDTLKVGESLQFTGGLRWEKYKTDFNGLAINNTTGAQTYTALDTVGDLLSFKVGALYKPAKNGSVYISTANSKQPPGGANFTLSAAAGANNANFKPQEGTNIEVGTKWEFMQGKVAVNGALFKSENKNESVTDPVDQSVTQIGKRSVKGIELSLVGQVTNELNLTVGYAHMTPKIERAAATTQGGLIQWSPKDTFTSWATYTLPMGVTLGGGVRYVASALTSSNVDQMALAGIVQMPKYTVVDALVAYEVNKNINLLFNLHNVFDEKYMSSVNSGRSRYLPGAPRSALLTANFTY
jgi:catecholate siderophore receptor